MNIRFVFIFVISFLSSHTLIAQNKSIIETIILTGQEYPYKNVITKNIYFDVATLKPVIEFMTDSINKETRYYYHYKGKKREVTSNISYKNGDETFEEYKNRIYWNKYSGDEMNASCLYVILFDKRFKIKDIRIIARNGYNNLNFNFDKLVKEVLKSSEGKWEIIKSESKSDWYFAMGRFKIG